MGIVNENDNLIIKLLNDITVARLSEDVLIFIKFLICGVIIPLKRQIDDIKIKPINEILKPKQINDIVIDNDIIINKLRLLIKYE